MTYSDIIGLWPTHALFAKDIGVKDGTARKWHERDTLPSSYWITVCKASHDRGLGVTVDVLALIAHNRRRASLSSSP